MPTNVISVSRKVSGLALCITKAMHLDAPTAVQESVAYVADTPKPNPGSQGAYPRIRHRGWPGDHRQET